jgi:acyl-CoA synthetase (AMP-forming)/AMP-acid ligase II
VSTVFSALERTAAAHGGKPFLEFPSHNARFTYAQALERAHGLAAVYRRRGYGAGHRVALRLENRPEFLLHFLALNSLGASVVPVNPDARAAELDYIVAHSEASLVVDSALVGRFDPPQAPRPGDAAECALLYTSGTTGKPKGCLLGNFYFLNVGRRYLDEGGLCAVRPGEDRLITPLPLFHMNALAVSTTAMILSAGCLIQLDRFHPRSWWRDVAESGATIVHYLGVMPALLNSQAEGPHEKHHRVRFGYGANANPKDHAAFEARFGFPLIEAWAMTETGGGALIAASREPRHVGTRCVGVPPADLEVRLSGNQELLVRHKGEDPRRGFFSGYLKDPQATDEAWRDGWFHTGDSLRRGPDGSLHFVDRLKNIIRRAGENIAALEVEAALAGHPAIAQVAVIAVPDEVRDEEVMACVVPCENQAGDRALAISIQDWCLERLAYFKAPGHVAFLKELPTTATNKVQKAKLADFAVSAADSHDLRDRKKRTAAKSV